MIDIKFLKEKIDDIKDNIRNRGVKVDVEKLKNLNEQKSELLKKIEELRQKRNENAEKLKQKIEQSAKKNLVEAGKNIKERLSSLEEQFEILSKNFSEEFLKVPNFSHPNSPKGLDEENSKQLEIVGNIPTFDFETKNHEELGLELDIIDFEHGASVSGNKFYFLKNEGVFLELGLIRYATDIITNHGFTPYITPDLAKDDILEGIGFNPRGEEDNIYNIQNTNLSLIGTAEIPLGGYHQNSIIEVKNLPIKMGGISHCFRKEAGAAGKHSRGLYRVHQFSKVEMFVICHPDDSEKYHKEILEIEKEIFSGLNIPFRIMDICVGDLGNPAYRKFDLEAYMVSKKDGWGEITSASNCTDYQSRRLKIRYKDKEGQKGYTHTLNGTAIAVSRAIISILENFQTQEGEVIMPPKLVPYLGFEKIKKKSKNLVL